MIATPERRRISKSYLETLKGTFPEIFSCNNTLKEVLTKAKDFIGPPYNFSAISSVITPFDKFILKYIPYKSPKDEKRYSLHISFFKNNFNQVDESVLKNFLVLQYVGDENKDGQQFLESDKLFLNFKQDNVKVLFDLKKREISFTNGPYIDKEFQTAVINFDQITNQENLLKNFNENSDMKIFNIEVDEKRNLMGFKYRSKLYGSEIRSITLPLKMKIKLGNSFEITSRKIPREQIKSITVRGVNLDIKRIKGKNIIFIKHTEGYFKFTLNELKLLYYVYSLKLNPSESASKIGIKKSIIYVLRNSLINKNPCRNYLFNRLSESKRNASATIIDILVEKFTELGILNEKFLKELETALTK